MNNERPDFDLGDHFNKSIQNMLKIVPPTKQFSGKKQIFKHSVFFLCFVHDFESMYDSEIAFRQGQTDLSQTIFYKLLTMCGSFLSFNAGKKQ